MRLNFCQFHWDYLINYNENENDNENIDPIKKKEIHLAVDIEINIQNIACLGRAMPLCNKQHLRNI